MLRLGYTHDMSLTTEYACGLPFIVFTESLTLRKMHALRRHIVLQISTLRPNPCRRVEARSTHVGQ